MSAEMTLGKVAEMELSWLAVLTWGHFAPVFLPPCYLACSGMAGAQPFSIPMILKTDVMK